MKKEFYIEGLDCAVCASKIEKEVGCLNGINSAVLNFNTQKLKVDYTNEYSNAQIKSMIEKVAKSHEPDAEVSEQVSEKEESNKSDIIMLLISILLFIGGYFIKLGDTYRLIMFLLSYLAVGTGIVWLAFKNIFKGEVFDENFLMTIATAGAFIIGEYPEGAAVMILYKIGSYIEKRAVSHSRKSINALLEIRPQYANLIRSNGGIEKVKPEEVKPGDSIIVKPGERVPLDGKIVSGYSQLDTRALTGETIPIEVKTGDEILSGSVNISGMLTVLITKSYSESTVSKILELTENASQKKAVSESFIRKFAKIYTPAVVIGAILLAFIPPLLFKAELIEWVKRALAFLVVSCPCALVISIPLSFFSGIGRASGAGILIKGSGYLEALSHADTIVFDKTGTLTKGRYIVTSVIPANGFSKGDLLELCAYAESGSNHPVSEAILKEYGREIDKNAPISIEEAGGLGIKANISGKSVLVGNKRFLTENGVSFTASDTGKTFVYAACDGVYAGMVEISDEIKPNIKKALAKLRSLGIKKTAMLSGDSSAVCGEVGKELNIDEVYSELLPQDKVNKLETIMNNKKGIGGVIFAGDGINDAPVLARADIGIAMGGIGSDAAVEAADIILMTDDISKIADGINISRLTLKISRQNILFALSVKLAVLLLSAFGLANMWEAVFADVGVTVLAILNSLRILKGKI